MTKPPGSISSERDEQLAADERWTLVQRIAGSEMFGKAAQLREILLYVSRRAIVEHVTSISEHDIAREVLGRRGDFDPTDDNIVRVQMGHLRKRLESYSTSEGKHDARIVTIPKGSYVPRFDAQVLAAEDTSPSGSSVALDPMLKTVPQPPSQANEMRAPWRTWLIGAGLTAGLLMVFAIGRWSKPGSGGPARPDRDAMENPLLRRIFISDLPVSIVVADTNLVVLQNTLHTDITIDQYASREYPDNILKSSTDPSQRETLRGLALRKFTSLADLNVAAKCIEFSHDYGVKSTIRYARSMNARDFEKGNFILVGSRTADPWVELFEPRLNFAYEEDAATHVFHFRNRHPLPGEQEVYEPVTGNRISTVSYVDIAIEPNLTKTGSVLLLNAATMDGNEAAVEMLFRKSLPPVLTKLLDSNSIGGNQVIEILLRDYAVDGVVNNFDVVAVRKIQ